jgi:hypothetical protein
MKEDEEGCSFLLSLVLCGSEQTKHLKGNAFQVLFF